LDVLFRFARMSLLAIAALTAGGWYLLDQSKISGEPGDVTGSVTQAPERLGPSGLPLPRFVSLKSTKVNVRKGPSSDHAVAWVFHRKGMPIEIIAEFENWRKIRDSEGAEGWILQQMLSGKRSAIVMDYGHGKGAALRPSPDEADASTAILDVGVSGMIDTCDGTWCEINAQGYEGYVQQSRIWGVYPGEVID
jgi:SH3-like domain-containing protein